MTRTSARQRFMRASLLAASAMGIVAVPAHAQDSANTLEEITVTARKQTENLQDTPISISAYSGERLEAQGITQVSRIADFTPNLSFSNVPANSGVASNAAVYIRGIAHALLARRNDPGVPYRCG